MLKRERGRERETHTQLNTHTATVLLDILKITFLFILIAF